MRLAFETRVTSGRDTLDTAIRAIASAEVRGDVIVYAATGRIGGLTAYRLTPDGTLALHHRAAYAPERTGAPTGDIAVIPTDSGRALVFGAADGRLMARGLRADGRFADPLPGQNLAEGPRTVERLDYLSDADGGGVLALGDTEGIHLYEADAAGALESIAALPAPAGTLALGPGPGEGATLAALSASGLRGARLTSDGALLPVAATGPSEGLAIAAPTAVEAVSAHGTQFVLVAAAGTQTLSVLEIATDGSTELRDHLIDTGATRFGAVQDIASAEAGGQVFVVAGGGDDGVSLFTLLPDGRLLHLDSLASAAGARLDDVTRLHAHVVDGALHVFAATEDARGLVHLATTADPGTLRRGTGLLEGGPDNDLLVGEGPDGVLRGGAGDDILVAGLSDARLTGGDGADLFVLRGGEGTVRITDFEPGTDRLDLSDFTMLRGPGQIEGTETANGARLSFRDNLVRIESHDGAPIAPEALFGPHFPWPDRIAPDLLSRVSGGGPDADPPPDSDPEPDAEPDAEPDPGPSPDSDPAPDDPTPTAGPEGARVLRIGADAPDPWLAGARVTFTPEDGSAVTVEADGDGRIDLSRMAGERGRVEILRAYTAADPELGVDDALNVLRLAVGLEPSFGPARPVDRLAADFDGDGTISVADALDVLRSAVGLEASMPARWLFVEPDAPASGDAPEGISLTIAEDGAWELAAAVLLTGDLGAGA